MPLPVGGAAVHCRGHHFVSRFMPQEDINFQAAERASNLVDDAVYQQSKVENRCDLFRRGLELEKVLDQLLLAKRCRRKAMNRRSRSGSHGGHSGGTSR